MALLLSYIVYAFFYLESFVEEICICSFSVTRFHSSFLFWMFAAWLVGAVPVLFAVCASLHAFFLVGR